MSPLPLGQNFSQRRNRIENFVVSNRRQKIFFTLKAHCVPSLFLWLVLQYFTLFFRRRKLDFFCPLVVRIDPGNWTSENHPLYTQPQKTIFCFKKLKILIFLIQYVKVNAFSFLIVEIFSSRRHCVPVGRRQAAAGEEGKRKRERDSQ